jgi:hypothetical protein
MKYLDLMVAILLLGVIVKEYLECKSMETTIKENMLEICFLVISIISMIWRFK